MLRHSPGQHDSGQGDHPADQLDRARDLPQPWGARVARFTLLDAARQVTALHPATDLFAPALSLLVLLAWPALTLLAAALLITRRDA